MSLPQLIMRNPDITDLPPLDTGNFTLRTHRPGDEEAWEGLIEATFRHHFDFDFLIKAGDYSPEKVFYLWEGDRAVATATGVEHPDYPGEGWFRMVAVHPEVQGKGLGKKICLAVLHDLARRGYKSALLSTDDDRISAIRLYLSLGFEPYCTHESHPERWRKIIKNGKDPF
ncbi:MAG: GNAT family N-acetyltransferase [Clostridia bacterium]|nr:GNAT family N-acetyltransferase [Clostridia bacterium]